MTRQVPQIFDHDRRRFLQARLRPGSHLFLYDRAADELITRVLGITRDFSRAFIYAPETHRQHLTQPLASKCSAIDFRSSADLSINPEAWSFQKDHYDLILILGTLHCVNDLPGSLVQIRDALIADGVFLMAIPGGDSLRPLRDCLLQSESELTSGAGLHIHPSIHLHDLAALMQRAQFALPVVDQDTVRARYRDLSAIFSDIKQMGGANCLNDRPRRSLRRDILFRAEEILRSIIADPEGRLVMTYDLLFATGWAPHESQPKPLKPGSAQHRVADALGSAEVSLPRED